MKPRLRLPLACLALFLCTATASAQPDLADYRTVDKAVTTKLVKTDVTALHVPAFLGVDVAADAQEGLIVQEVAAGSPADKAGLKRGDHLLTLNGIAVKLDADFREWLRERAPAESVKLTVLRDGKQVQVTAVLVALSRPVAQGPQHAFLGLDVIKAKDGTGLAVEQVTFASPAEKASLKVGDILLKIDGIPLPTPEKLSELIAARKPGDSVTLTLAGAGKAVEKKVVLAAAQVAEKKGGWDNRFNNIGWKKPVYRLAVICIEYPDQKHNPKITSKDWEESLYSTGTYTKTSVTGQPVFGSVNDLYVEQSYGKLRIEGKVFDFVEVGKKRSEYATAGRQVLFTEAVDKLLARDGKDALSTYDGVFFLYAGILPQGTTRGGGSLYWPHRGSFSHGSKRWPYFICPEGGQKMANISVFAHEFGHMLGLPDLYARPEAPNIEGLGQWCLMSNQVGNGRPQHASAWCKERLGWIEPALIDPTVKQKLILRPVEDSAKECYKILIHRDGSEYLLLENRAKKGFDKSLAGEGLLIWRVVRGQPVLEESHGVEGPSGPRVFLNAVPYPSTANDSFTPYTVPSSRSKIGGGLPVYITNIQRLPDGRVTFHIGYEYQ
jgi:M6 family metalloprotease-like protein